MKFGTYFPSRLFLWFLSQQILFSTVLFIALNGALFIYIERSGFDADVISFGREVALISLAAAFFVLILVSLMMARRLVVPLGRLIAKTRRLREFPFDSEELEPEALTFDEPGEWFDLERALNKLGRDLRAKTIRLSREKTELRTIMSAVSEAVLAITAEKRILFFNSQFAFLFHPDPSRKDILMSEIFRSPAVLGAYDQALRTGEPSRAEIKITTLGDSKARYFQLSVTPLRKKHNQEVYGAVGIFYDITEMKQAERIRIEFVGNVSHELRTPLTAINGYLQTLTEDFKAGRTDQSLEFLNILTQNVGRLKNLVEDLLDLSSLESGKELKLEAVSVQDVTESVLAQVQSRKHKIQIRYGFEQLVADPRRVEQVLRNLMENAVRYVPEGRKIEIDWRLNADKYELHVKDDGPGISAEHQARLFERFYRIDEARSRETGGTGIGLSLVKHIMQRHGGQVLVRSEMGKGSEFICEFPANPLS